MNVNIACWLLLGVIVCGSWGGVVSAELAAPPESDTKTGLVVPLTALDDGSVRWGTNHMPVAVFTNRLWMLAPDADAVVIQGGLSNPSTSRLSPAALAMLVNTGKRILVSDTTTGEDSPSSATTPAANVFRVDSATLSRLSGGATGSLVTVSSAIGLDSERGEYELREVGLGLWNDRLWLIRELPDERDSDGGIRLQFRKTW